MSIKPTHYNDILEYDNKVIGRQALNALSLADKACKVAKEVGYCEIEILYENGSKIKIVAK